MITPKIQGNSRQNKKRGFTIKSFSSGLFLLLPFLLMGQLLTACIPVAIGVASVTAIELGHDRRTVGRHIDDSSLEVELRDAYSSNEQLGSTVNISVTAVNGIVLLTGEVQTDEQRQLAEAIAKKYGKTKDVVNVLELSGKTNLTSRINDAYLTSKVKFKLLRAEYVSASDIKVVTERGKVYLLGLVTLEEEEDAVNAAKSVRGVTHIIKVFERLKPEADSE